MRLAMASICTLLGILVVSRTAAQATQPVYLRVNQVGYLSGETKLAFALTNENLSGRTFDVVAAGGGSASLTGTVGKDRGPYGDFSHLYELDFSSHTANGEFRLRIGSDSSPAFTIGGKAYAGVIGPSLTFFRVERCGDTGPLLHGICHLKDGIVANGPSNGKQIGADGGWHDAGDYLKFVTTTGFAAILMLHAYQRHPDVFADSNRNHVPDVLDEARVGLDWLLKMWDPNNEVLYYQVGDYRDHQEWGEAPGWRLPERDDVDRPTTRTVWACEEGKGANVAGKAAAALALGATLWNEPARSFYDPTLAARYLAAAQRIYTYGKDRRAAQSSTSDTTFDPAFTFYPEADWQDEMALAAAELYRATGTLTYLTDARSYAMEAGSVGSFYWGEVGALAQYEIARLDSTYTSEATGFLLEDLLAYQSRLDSNSFHAAEASFIWGSGETMLGAALTALWYEDLTGKSTYRSLAQAQRDYLLGANPWGVCLVNSLGTTWPRYPHHQVIDLTRSELTGFWAEGPVSLDTFRAQGITLRRPDSFAAFQSAVAVYHDDVADYTTNEPGIHMNAAGLALASWYAPAADTSILTTLYYPRLATTDRSSSTFDDSEYTGIALTNLDTADATLTFTALDTKGTKIMGAAVTNPAWMTLRKGAQLASVDSQLFGVGLTSARPVGWLKVESTVRKIAGFFLAFNATLSTMDGADVSSGTVTSFILPEIEGQGFTQIHVANPNSASVTITFDLLKSDGTARASSVTRTLNPDGALAEAVTGLFPSVTAERSDYLRVTATQGVVPFEYFGKRGDYVEGLNGEDAGGGATTLYSPQYVVGSGRYRTTLSVVNTTSLLGSVAFRLIGGDGKQIGATRELSIAGRGKLSITDSAFFLDPKDDLIEGYVEITSSGPKLVGSVSFGDPAGTTFATALPLVSQLRTSVVFSQVASNETYFTGIAILNPNSSAANATLEVYDETGNLVVSGTEAIPAGQSKAKLLTDYFPSLVAQNRSKGYISLKSDIGVASFALFGTRNLSVLSAIPPQVVP